MFWVFLLFHLTLYIEAWMLYKKKLRKRSLILIIGNIVLTITNLIKFSSTFQIEIPIINYFTEEIITHPFRNLIWIILNLLNIATVTYVLNFATKKKKQNEYIKEIIYLFLTIIVLFLTIILFQQKANIIIFFLIGILMYLLIKYYTKKKKNYVLITMILLSLFTWYSYFTYTGAARLELFLKGFPKEAYETGLEEIKYYEEKNNKKFNVIQLLKLKNGEIGIIEVKNYIFIKIATANIDNVSEN